MSFWLATADSRHFEFEGAGETREAALDALRRALAWHASRYHLDSEWVSDMMDSVESDNSVREYLVGAGYRNKSQLTG